MGRWQDGAGQGPDISNMAFHVSQALFHTEISEMIRSMKEWDEDDQDDDEADDDGGDADAAAAADDDHDDDDVDGEEAADAHANVTITLWHYYSQIFAKFLEARLGTCNAKRAIKLCCSLQWTYWEVFVFSGVPNSRTSRANVITSGKSLNNAENIWKREGIPPQIAGTILMVP